MISRISPTAHHNTINDRRKSYVRKQYEMGERHACRLLELSRSTYRYRERNPERDQELRARLKELAA